MYVLCMKSRTTLQIEKEILEELKKAKKYKRETYNEVLARLLKKRRKING